MSDAALKYALDIAKSMNMKIKLVRIIPEIVDFSSMSFWTRAEKKRVRKEISLMKKNAHVAEYEKLQKQIALVNSRGVQGSAFVTEGPDVVEDYSADKERKALPRSDRQQKAEATRPLIKITDVGQRR
jgi:hypothetical protein